MAGSVRVVVSYPVERASKNEDTAQILAGCDGYRISGDAYAALGKDHGFKQEAGDAPVLPDDAEVTVIEQATSQGEVLVKTTESHSVLAAQSQGGVGLGPEFEFPCSSGCEHYRLCHRGWFCGWRW